MKFTKSIDLFIDDMRADGRINSDRTEVAYRSRLRAHADDVSNRDPRTTNRDDVKRTLRRWNHPNTQSQARAVLVSFYDWAMEEGHRKDNPARQTRRPKRRKTSIYRLTHDETISLLDAAITRRERWATHIGVCAGARNSELRHLKLEHFLRPGFIWFSADIAKGGKERWVPVISDLEPIVEEILDELKLGEHVFCAQRWRNPPQNTTRIDLAHKPGSSQALRTLVMTVAARATIAAHVHPHLMRHAFGDHVARHAGLHVAQAVLGHESVETTEGTYVGKPTLDELADAVAGLRIRPAGHPPDRSPAMPEEAPTGIEPVGMASRPTTGHHTTTEGARDGPSPPHGQPPPRPDHRS